MSFCHIFQCVHFPRTTVPENRICTCINVQSKSVAYFRALKHLPILIVMRNILMNIYKNLKCQTRR